MNKNFVAIAAGIVVLIVGYLFFSSRQASAPTKPEITEAPTEAQVQETAAAPSTTEGAMMKKEANTVTYSDSGFSPKSLTVPAGTTVTFVNNSDSSMWVASSPHPVHTDLPGFDELEGAKKGEKYSFTFVKKGAWKYHNHLSPPDFGAITVE